MVQGIYLIIKKNNQPLDLMGIYYLQCFQSISERGLQIEICHLHSPTPEKFFQIQFTIFFSLPCSFKKKAISRIDTSLQGNTTDLDGHKVYESQKDETTNFSMTIY